MQQKLLQQCQNQEWKKRIISQSTNAKIIIIECTKINKQSVQQQHIIKIINLSGEWPQSPCIFERKKHPKLREFIILNKSNKPTQKFIQQSIHHLLNLSSYEHKLLILKTQPKIDLPTQIYISNSGNRVSFWLSDEQFQTLGSIQQIAQSFKPFTWLRKKDNIIQNQIEYGSQNFINVIEWLSLKSMSKVLALGQYSLNEFMTISEDLIAVTSLVNYNYRYFYPPKNATKFLKSTCGIILTCLSKLQQKRSLKWAEHILLKSMFQIRPTICLANILSMSAGPVYFKSNIFSQKFYQEVQKVYYLGRVMTYSNELCQRNQMEYVVNLSRLFGSCQEMSQFNKKIKQNKRFYFNYDKKNTENELISQKTLINILYKESQQCYLSQIQSQFELFQNNPKSTNNYIIDDKNRQINDLNQICLNFDMKFCYLHGNNINQLSSDENNIKELINMWKSGNDYYCKECFNQQNLSNLTNKEEKEKENMIINSSRQQLLEKKYLILDKIYKRQAEIKQIKSESKKFRQILISQKHFSNLISMISIQKSQSNIFLDWSEFHDSFQLSSIAGELTSQKYNKQYQIVLGFYLQKMINQLSKVKQNNESEQYKIGSFCDNLKQLRIHKYSQIELNIITTMIKQQFSFKDQNQHTLQQKNQLFTELHSYIQLKIQNYQASIKQHYKSYKQKMTGQYQVTSIELKQMIAKFQATLKSNIIQTTKDIVHQFRWVLAFFGEYIKVKERNIKLGQIRLSKFGQDDGLNIYNKELQFLLKLCSQSIETFNQPGQAKTVQQLYSDILDFIIIIIKSQISIRSIMEIKYKQEKFDIEVVQILLENMVEHFVKEKIEKMNEDGKKLVNKHFEKFKSMFKQKFGEFNSDAQSVNHNFCEQITKYQHNLIKIEKLTLQQYHQKQKISLSSVFYQNNHFITHQSTYISNSQIRTFINLINSLTNKCWKNQTLFIQLKGEKENQKLKLSIMYKIISQTLQKQENKQKIINMFKSKSTILINLINYLISQVFSSKFNELNMQNAIQQKNLIEQLKDNLELYFQRQRYYYSQIVNNNNIKTSPIQQILQFLFTNRSKFFQGIAKTQSHKFQVHYHLLIQIMLLNTFPLFEIELIFKSDLKNIWKLLTTCQFMNKCTQLQVYYIKVIEVRYNKAKQKRKQQIQNKKQKQEEEGKKRKQQGESTNKQLNKK